MAFDTKIKIDDQHVIQISGTTLTLNSGTTTQYDAHPTFTEDTQLVDKKYVDDNITSGVTSGSTYDGGSPATVEVGGLPVDTTLTGLTSNEILECILYPTCEGVLTAPSMVSVTLSQASPAEIGSVKTFDVTASFDRGSIVPQYDSASPNRSGAPISYCFTGAQTNTEYACVTDSAIRAVTTYTVVAGSQTWGSCTCHSIGVQPIDNKGDNYDSPLAAGIVAPASATLTGIYPYFYGASGTTPTAGQDLLDSGTKVVADSNGQIDIPYGAATDQWLWFAIPAASTDKLGWYEASNNNGNIGSPSDLFEPAAPISVDSPSAFWSGQSYEFYIANWSTDVTGTDFCMTNTTQQ